MKYFIWIVLLRGILTHGSSSFQYRGFYAHVTLGNDKRLASNLIESVRVSGAIHCASLCARNSNCKSFNFGLGICELLGTFYCESPLAVVDEAGFKYVDVDEDVGDGAIQDVLSSALCTNDKRCSVKCASQIRVVGQLCVDSSICQLPNTECRDDLCQCIISYAYDSQANESCVPDCATYGSSFSHKNNWTLRGFNDANFNEVENVTACLKHCEEFEGCRSAEYSPSDRVCYLSLSTCYNNNANCGTNPYFNFYIRNCV